MDEYKYMLIEKVREIPCCGIHYMMIIKTRTNDSRHGPSLIKIFSPPIKVCDTEIDISLPGGVLVHF